LKSTVAHFFLLAGSTSSISKGALNSLFLDTFLKTMDTRESHHCTQSTTITTFPNKPMRDMSRLHSSTPNQVTAAAAAEQREPLYDLPSISQSTSSLSLSVTEANFNKEVEAQHSYHQQEPTDTRILRGAEILRMQLQRQQQQLIDQEARHMSPPRMPSRALQYRNSAYISDTDEDEDHGDHDPWGLNPKTSSKEGKPAQFTFPAEGDAAKWAQLSYDYDDLNQSPSQQLQPVPQNTTKKTASPDQYIQSPPWRTMPETSLPDASLENLFAASLDNPKDLDDVPALSGPPSSDHPSTRFRSPPRGGPPSNSHSNPSSPSKSYQMGRNSSQISTAESDALDFLVSQFPTDHEPEESLSSKEEETLSLIQEEKSRHRDVSVSETMGMRKASTAQPKPAESDSESPCINIVPPFSKEYQVLLKDPAYLHAQQAGTLWQSLVSQHVKFPTKWWNGARSPSMGIGERRLWQYVGRHRVGGDEALNQMVYNRGSAGRILVHLVVRDVITMAPALDIAIGCFHPNARGVRSTPTFQPSLEDCRDIWLATRRRLPDDLAVENLLRDYQDPTTNQGESPLGPKHAVHNGNMRFIFGEKPPLHTAFVLESTLHGILTDRFANKEMPPSLVMLQRFLKVR
jgi:hypothetical protein